MIGVVIVAHGEFADALLGTAAMICGEPERAEAVSFDADESPEALYEKVSSALERLGGEALLVCDIPGGTPANVCARLVLERGLRAVCGSNVPMLMELLLGRDANTTPEEAARLALDAGREGLVDLNELLADQQG